MFQKDWLTGNESLHAETTGDFAERIKRERPDMAGSLDKLKELLSEDVYKRAFSNIQTFNKSGDKLLICSGGVLQRSFLERDCIPALKEAFGVKRVQIIG